MELSMVMLESVVRSVQIDGLGIFVEPSSAVMTVDSRIN